jgi:D-amino-acid oxidase
VDYRNDRRSFDAGGSAPRDTTPVRIAVVGGGVSGLTCGVRLLEEGARVTLVTRDAPASTTSAVAGAVWFPYRVSPNERTGPWGSVGYERFSQMAEQPGMPACRSRWSS